MAHYKRGRPKNQRGGCIMCKPHKMNGAKNRDPVSVQRRRSNLPTNRKPTTVGEVLFKEFLVPSDLTMSRLAQDMGVKLTTVRELLADRLRVDTVLAVKLSLVFGTTPEFWLGLQASMDEWYSWP